MNAIVFVILALGAIVAVVFAGSALLWWLDRSRPPE